MRSKQFAVVLLTGLSLMLLAAPAWAQTNPAQSTYGPSSVHQLNQTSSSGSLPFTGVNVGLVVLAGVVLLAAGTALRVYTRARTEA